SYWRKRYRQHFAATHADHDPTLMGKLLIAAFPDRIGRLRAGANKRYRFVSGQGGRLTENLRRNNEKFLVATELKGKRAQEETGEGEIMQATPLELDTILELYPDCRWQKEVFWDNTNGRVLARKVQQLGKLNLVEKPAMATTEERSQVVLAALRSEGLELLHWNPALETFRARVALIREYFPTDNWPDLSDQQLLATMELWLLPFLGQTKNRNDLKRINLFPPLQTFFDWQQLQRLDQLAPERLQVPSGSNHKIQYGIASKPILAVKLQEMFGTTATPSIAGGRIPLQLHLLSPAGRPLQVTQDLATFWDEAYPEIKKEMKGRYPKHPWPDDPRNAAPTRHTKQRAARS
ncbi:MAG: ATP-dependent helicase HrpB, partial [Desulfuromonadales bacterium]|nr:ATP-dependent helicase HrpB [Desulfuromonadales bacterium]